MLKACLDKLIPNARPASRVGLPDIGGDACSGDHLISRLGAGEVTLEDAKTVMGLLEVNARLHEHNALQERAEQLMD